MTREYVVLSTYTDKQTGKPVSSLAPISSGTSKASGCPYEIANLDAREIVDGQYRVGTRLTASMTLTVAQAAEDNAQDQRSVKLGK